MKNMKRNMLKKDFSWSLLNLIERTRKTGKLSGRGIEIEQNRY